MKPIIKRFKKKRGFSQDWTDNCPIITRAKLNGLYKEIPVSLDLPWGTYSYIHSNVDAHCSLECAEENDCKIEYK